MLMPAYLGRVEVVLLGAYLDHVEDYMVKTVKHIYGGDFSVSRLDAKTLFLAP